MTTGDKIRRARLAAGLSQVEAAKRAGTTQPTLSAWECGRKQPRISTLRRLAAVLGIECRELV